MSVNYYAFGPFPGGEKDGEGLHIGQHLYHKTFLMRAHPDLGLETLADWKTFLRHSDVSLENENGISPSVGDFLDIVLRRYDNEHQSLKRRWIPGYARPGCYVDPASGVEFCTEEFS